MSTDEPRPGTGPTVGDPMTSAAPALHPGIDDAETAQTVLELLQARIGYQAALRSAGGAGVPSLLEFLR